MSSVWPLASAGSSDETIDAVATCGDTACAPTKRPVGSFSAARSPAARRAGTIVAAPPFVRATIVKEPVERWPNWSRRIVSARPASVPGSVNRFVSRLDSPDAAQPPITKSAIHVTRIVLRWCRTQRVQWSSIPPRLPPRELPALDRGRVPHRREPDVQHERYDSAHRLRHAPHLRHSGTLCAGFRDAHRWVRLA